MVKKLFYLKNSDLLKKITGNMFSSRHVYDQVLDVVHKTDSVLSLIDNISAAIELSQVFEKY